MSNQSNGKIIKPISGDRVGSRIKIHGELNRIPSGSHVWIAHRRNHDGLLWPKEPKVNLRSDGRFSLTTFEGGAKGLVVLSLLQVDDKTDKLFRDWVYTGHKTGDFPGISPSTINAKELHNVSVTYDKEKPLRVFYSYSHEDEGFRLQLEKHLSVFRRRGFIEDWHDRQLIAGEYFDKRIAIEIDKADIILLLISANFIASDYCYENEMIRALERHESGEARVVPIIVRAVEWHETPIGGLLALPKDGKPVKSWQDEDEAWADVAQGLRDLIEDIR